VRGYLALGASARVSSALLACEFDEAFEGGFGLPTWAAPCTIPRAAGSSPVFAPREGLCCEGPSRGLTMFVLQAWA